MLLGFVCRVLSKGLVEHGGACNPRFDVSTTLEQETLNEFCKRFMVFEFAVSRPAQIPDVQVGWAQRPAGNLGRFPGEDVFADCWTSRQIFVTRTGYGQA